MFWSRPRKNRLPRKTALKKNQFRKATLPALCARVVEVGLSTKLGWELGETIARIHLDPVISTTTSVGWLESSVESRAMEGHEFVETVADTLEGAAGAIDNSVGPTDLVASGVGLANDLLGDLDHSVEDVADSTSEFTRGIVFRPWRGLDVCLGRHGKGECECDQ